MNYPSRKQSVPDNLHKPPSPKESDVIGDPLTERPKQSPAASMSSIKPPSTYQPLFVLQQQQQQQKVLISQTKPSPPLTNKRSTAIPRKPLATSTKNHSDQLDLEYNQMNLTKSISNEVSEITEGDQKGRVITRYCRSGSLDRKKRHNVNKPVSEKPRGAAKSQVKVGTFCTCVA